MVRIKHGLAQERRETREMLVIYTRYTQGKASKEEMKIANKQFGDLLKGLGIGVFAVLPFAPITIPLVVKFGRMFGIEVMPSAFHKVEEQNTFSLEVKSDIQPSNHDALQISKKGAAPKQP